MMRRFHKMHGLGNDFVVIDARTEPVAITAAHASAIADRHIGIGCDQIVILEASQIADARMRIFNSDGSSASACGNAARAVALVLGDPARLETPGGVIALAPEAGGATVDMGAPRFEWDSIPLSYAMDTRAMPVRWGDLENPVAVNVGNPHLVFFVADASAVDLATVGPVIEHDPLFPDRINVSVATVTGQSAVMLRVWERGAGQTRACGTGACATAVAAIGRKLVTAPVAVALPGGMLTIDWQPGETIRMTGPATHVFSGEIDLDLLSA